MRIKGGCNLMPRDRVIVIGAGIGGLTSAAQLAARGMRVRVLESADYPGGKMRQIDINGRGIDSGPTVFTMRWIFEDLFSDAGASLSDYLRLQPLEIIARHAWSEHERLDLFSDHERSIEAIGDFAGAAEARGYRAFSEQARIIYETLDKTFIRDTRPSILGLVGRCGIRGFGNLSGIKPYDSLWQTLGQYFKDERLRQLFGRYSTYCGSSPFESPATLMLIAHVEQQGVWSIEGGMHQLACALERLAQEHGAEFRYGTRVEEILVEHGRTTGVRLADGEVIPADAVVFNGDPAALAAGHLGATAAKALPGHRHATRSLSAITWSLVAKTEGFPLARHNVFFSRDYAAEFKDLFRHARLPDEGTLYICAQDRGAELDGNSTEGERLFCLLNAPARGDVHPFDASEIDQCEQRVFSLLERYGLRVCKRAQETQVTTPARFDQLFPATGGALYGQATHGWRASFNRPGSRTRIHRLYLAGGSTHPGAGVPMAAMSGRLAANCLFEDLGST